MNPLPRLFCAILMAFPLSAQGAEQCTSAVFSPASVEGGRPMLWKNRDTDVLSNKVVYVKEAPYSYLGVVDLHDESGRHVWAGLNSEGFAIINTVAYNLPSKPNEAKDLEGAVMADALRTCRTVEEFEAMLQRSRGHALGCATNFGVLDATGKALIFETHNHGFTKWDAAEAPPRYLVNTNYARSGEKGQGAGYLRFERATEILGALAKHGPVRPEDVLRHAARDTGNVLLKQPTLSDLKGLPAAEPRWVITKDSINKSYTSTCVLLVGKRPGDPASRPMMWVIPGEPVTSIAVPIWVDAQRSPEPLWNGPEAPLWAESWRVKKRVRNLDEEKEKQEYLNLAALDNREGRGVLAVTLAAEDTITKRTREFLATPRSAAELAKFQEEMSQLALAALRRIP